MNYIVNEMQTYSDDTGAALKYEFTDQTMSEKKRLALAERKYHLTLADAAISTCKIHAVTLMDFSGRMLKREQYTHEVEPAEEVVSE